MRSELAQGLSDMHGNQNPHLCGSVIPCIPLLAHSYHITKQGLIEPEIETVTPPPSFQTYIPGRQTKLSG